MDGLSQLLAIADELYGLLPEDFVPARDERVRTLRRDGNQARALAVKDLRRPSVAAWLVNALVRHRRGEVEQLLALGEALRDAQRNLDAGQLRALDRQRRAVLAAIAREGRRLAQELGRPVSGQTAEEVEQTLRAALADPAAANAVRSGRLTASLSYAGFGGADLSEVVAVPGAGPLTGLPAPPAPDRGQTIDRSRTTDRRQAHDEPGDHGAGDAGPAADPPPGQGDGSVTPDPTAQDRTAQDRTARQRAEREQQARDRAAQQARARRESARREAAAAVRAAEDAARHAEGAALVAEQHRDGVQRREFSARQRLDHHHDRVAELESQLASARQAASAAAAGWAPLHAEAEAATARAEAARGLAERARATLYAARAHLADVQRDPDVPPDVRHDPDVDPRHDATG